MAMGKIQFVHNPNKDEPSAINAFVHCGQCVEDWKARAEGTNGTSPETWARLSIGYTAKGFQVRCVRHGCNVDSVEVRIAPEVPNA